MFDGVYNKNRMERANSYRPMGKHLDTLNYDDIIAGMGAIKVEYKLIINERKIIEKRYRAGNFAVVQSNICDRSGMPGIFETI